MIFRCQRVWTCWLVGGAVAIMVAAKGAAFEWGKGSPEEVGMSGERLATWARFLEGEGTKGLLVVRQDRVVYEWYSPGHGRSQRHYTASMAKALVGGVAAAVVIDEGRIGLDDPVARWVPEWRSDPAKRTMTLRHLGSHTSGLQDAWVTAEAGRIFGLGGGFLALAKWRASVA